MRSNTTIVIVPGAWHSPECFEQSATYLRNAGYHVSPVSLASVGASPPLKDFQPDVFRIRDAITSAIDAGQKVVVVSHSYGGIPSCEAIKGLDISSQQAAGKTGGVTQKIFLASFLLPAESNLLIAVGGQAPPWIDVSEDQMEAQPIDPGAIFYNDMSPSEQEKWSAKLKPHSYQTLYSKLTYEAWRHVPSAYIYCTKDNAMLHEYQKAFVEHTAQGVHIKTETLEASHSPFLSMPEETAKAIQRLIEQNS